MTFKEFTRWCNARACDGCWGISEAITCIDVGTTIRKMWFWKRERVWKEQYRDEIVSKIVEPINVLIREKYGPNTKVM